MTSREIEEYRALRDTIRERSTARVWIVLAGFGIWAALALGTAALAELPKAGFDTIVPADGAFYLYADVGRRTEDSLAFARAMLDETGVAATPGVDFDEARGRRFLRFSYSGTTADMAEAALRLRQWRRLQA